MKNEIIIFKNQNVKLEVNMKDDTVWLTQQQMAELFDSSRTNIIEHINHIYSDGELDKNSTCQDFRQVRKEGNRDVTRSIPFYNAFGDDGIILHELLGYKYIEHKKLVGYPEVAHNKVINRLENEKISYVVYDKDVVIKEYKGILKNYTSMLKKAIENMDMEKRLERHKR